MNIFDALRHYLREHKIPYALRNDTVHHIDYIKIPITNTRYCHILVDERGIVTYWYKSIKECFYHNMLHPWSTPNYQSTTIIDPADPNGLDHLINKIC